MVSNHRYYARRTAEELDRAVRMSATGPSATQPSLKAEIRATYIATGTGIRVLLLFVNLDEAE